MPTRITIVTPSFNQGAFLAETIRSVASQRPFVHEFFVLDGGSTDESVGIIRRYAGQIDWWISEKDRGQTDAIARGMQRATGDVVVWINSDDVYLPGALARVQSAFDADPALDVLTGFMVLIDAQSRITHSYRVLAPGSYLMRHGPVVVSQPTTFIRRSLFERVGGLDTTLHCGMDHDLWSRLYRARPVWRTLPQHIVGFRRHAHAKGVSPQWDACYARENQDVRARYPELNHPAGCALGLWWYRLRQTFSGRHLQAMVESRRWRGRRVTDVFGDWPVQAAETPAGREPVA